MTAWEVMMHESGKGLDAFIAGSVDVDCVSPNAVMEALAMEAVPMRTEETTLDAVTVNG